jgi:hypothetical protein
MREENGEVSLRYMQTQRIRLLEVLKHTQPSKSLHQDFGSSVPDYVWRATRSHHELGLYGFGLANKREK